MFKTKKYRPFNRPPPPVYGKERAEELEPLLKTVVQIENLTLEELEEQNTIEIAPKKKLKDYPGMELLIAKGIVKPKPRKKPKTKAKAKPKARKTKATKAKPKPKKKKRTVEYSSEYEGDDEDDFI